MIIVTTSRQELEAARNYFFPFIRLLKQTQLNGVRDASPQSAEYLLVIAFNSLIDEVMQLAEKRLILSTAAKQKLKLTDAQGIGLYRSLLSLAIGQNQIYLHGIRNNWIAQIDQQLVSKNVFVRPVSTPQDIITEPDFYFDE